jgi:hypothetical protein
MISRCSDARIGEEKTLRASACELRAERTAPATSSRRRTSRTCSFKFNDRAALAVIVTCDAPVVGSQRAVTRDSPGIMSLSTSSLFALSSGERMVSPVVFPPGRARLATTPAPRMSSLIVTIGIVSVACWATLGARSPDAKMTSTFKRISSAASSGSCWGPP